MNNPCPLCDDTNTGNAVELASTHLFHTDKRREYYACPRCNLVFVPKPFHLSKSDEKAEYDKHENDLSDLGYIKFLSRLFNPLTERLNNLTYDKTTLRGLDFGCGPGPALAAELNSRGFHTELYDIYYHNNPDQLKRKYDFVTCTEVVEHFNQPKRDLAVLFSLVKPGGVLAIMTKLVINQQRFANWHYKNDPTHVSFFSKETFEHLANTNGFEVEFIDADVIFLTRV